MSLPRLLPSNALRTKCDPETFTFTTTHELEEREELLGQDRAIEAISFGIELRRHDYNIFIQGPEGSGRHSFLRHFLEHRAKDEATAADWCYVNNFQHPQKPRAISLPTSQGRIFRDHVHKLIQDMQAAIAAAFESKDYLEQKQALDEELKKKQERALDTVRKHAKARNIGLLRTPNGYAFAPVHEGKALSPDQFEKLSEEEKKRIIHDTETLSRELHEVMRETPQHVRETQEKIHTLDRETAAFAVTGLIDNLIHEYKKLEPVAHYLEEIKKDVIDNYELFLASSDPEVQTLKKLVGDGWPTDAFRNASVQQRYGVNLFIDHSESQGAPVLFEDLPTYGNLLGQIDHVSHMGALITDFHLIKPGSLHRANGGYLILDCRKVLTHPFSWDGLKRMLKSQKASIQPLSQIYGMLGTVTMEPEPIPLQVKVILIGDRFDYYLLQTYDPEFSELFKVVADFDDRMPRNPSHVERFAGFLAQLVRQESLRPLHRTAVARLVEESARDSGDAHRLSTRMRRFSDMVREADYWAGKRGKILIEEEEIDYAILCAHRRSGRLRDRTLEAILNGEVQIETKGERIGRINGLAVYEIGENRFARPHCISARIALGNGEVVDIEREVELGGPIHSKGVMILAGFLSAQYVLDVPLSFSATLVFEQSYGEIEGDSASAAELCALLSALGQMPLKQGYALTGSVNQHGELQVIGGVNEKIEGFFELCRVRGLTGEQGVIIPEANVRHLMLRHEVVAAAHAGQFHIHAASHIDHCLELLTGLPAGMADTDNRYPKDSANGKVQEQLRFLAEKRHDFSATDSSGKENKE